MPDPADELGYVMDAVRTIRQALDGRVPLIGFAGSPWTLACYMVEGRGGTDFHTIKAMMYQRPDLLHRLLEVNARAVTAYLNAQIEAGAQAIMIFDTWGGVLADGMYQQFSLAYMRRILGNLTPYRMERTNTATSMPKVCRPSCSPRAVLPGWTPCRAVAPTPWASTGR